MESSAGAQGELRRHDASHGPRKIGPSDGPAIDLGVLGIRFMAYSEETGGGFSLVEHPIAPHGLAAPLHKHTREDEYSFVLEGRMGAVLGDDVVEADVGEFVFKPRDQWHSFWNAGAEPCRVLEIISPGGFERYFEDLAAALAAGGPPDPVEMKERYGIEFDPPSIDRLCDEHGLTHPMQGMFKQA